LTPTISVTTEPILIKLETKSYHPKATMQNHISMRRHGWSGQIPSLPLFGFFVFLFFGFLVTRTGHASGPILTIYTSYDVFPRKDVPFGGVLILQSTTIAQWLVHILIPLRIEG